MHFSLFEGIVIFFVVFRCFVSFLKSEVVFVKASTATTVTLQQQQQVSAAAATFTCVVY